MTIKATNLLELFSKAKQLNLSVEVREDKDGDYVVRIYKMFYSGGFDETVFITQQGESNWDKRCFSFDYMMDVLDAGSEYGEITFARDLIQKLNLQTQIEPHLK